MTEGVQGDILHMKGLKIPAYASAAGRGDSLLTTLPRIAVRKYPTTLRSLFFSRGGGGGAGGGAGGGGGRRACQECELWFVLVEGLGWSWRDGLGPGRIWLGLDFGGAWRWYDIQVGGPSGWQRAKDSGDGQRTRWWGLGRDAVAWERSRCRRSDDGGGVLRWINWLWRACLQVQASGRT